MTGLRQIMHRIIWVRGVLDRVAARNVESITATRRGGVHAEPITIIIIELKGHDYPIFGEHAAGQ